jgi:hypothetical protein
MALAQLPFRAHCSATERVKNTAVALPLLQPCSEVVAKIRRPGRVLASLAGLRHKVGAQSALGPLDGIGKHTRLKISGRKAV